MIDDEITAQIRRAIWNGKPETVASLIGTDKERLEYCAKISGTWLHEATVADQMEVVRTLVDLGIDVNKGGGIVGGTALNDAALSGKVETVKFLLSCGAKMDVSEYDKNPLFGAIYGGHADVVKLLLEYGIDATVKYTTPKLKNTDALEFARQQSKPGIAKMLMEHLNIPDVQIPADQHPLPEEAGQVPVDFDALRIHVSEGARQAFTAVKAAHPDEKFYVFTLYTVDDAVVISPSCNSEEGYQRLAARVSADKSLMKQLCSGGASLETTLVGGFRWSPFEWEYDCVNADKLDSANSLINNNGAGFYDDNDPDGFVKFKAGVLASMVLGLMDLDKEGFFGTGKDRKALTLFCSIPDSFDAAWLEEDSARRLNPPAVFKAFAEQRLKYIAEDGDAEPSDVRDLYLSYFRGSKRRK